MQPLVSSTYKSIYLYKKFKKVLDDFYLNVVIRFYQEQTQYDQHLNLQTHVYRKHETALFRNTQIEAGSIFLRIHPLYS